MTIISIAVFLLLVFYIIFRKQIKQLNTIKKTVIFIYLIWWIICITLASTTYNNTFAIRNDTVIIFIIAILTFAFGFFVMDFILGRIENTTKKTKRILKTKEKTNFEKKLKNVQLIFQILLLIVVFYYKLKQIQVINIYGQDIKRMAVFEIGYIFSSTIEAAIFNYVICSVVNLLNVIMMRNIVEKKININVILQIAITIILFLINYSRIIFFELIIYFIFWTVILYGNSIKDYIKQNFKLISIISLLLVVLLLGSSIIRVGNITSIDRLIEACNRSVSQVTIYFSGGIKAFEQAVQKDYRQQIVEEYGKPTNGLATFAWVDEFIGNNNSISNVMGKIMQREIKIGQYQTINAYFTGLFNFYIDFGYFGIFFFQFLYGCFINWLIGFYLKKQNIGRGVLLVINLTFAILNVTRWFYQSIGNIILITLSIMLMIFLERGIVLKNENNVDM